MYLLSGFYIVGGGEQVAVRRFGRLQPELRTSGLHWDAPAPFVRLNRLNLAELRTVSIGSLPAQGQEILPTTASQPCRLLTGDNNVLQVRAQLHYRIDPAQISDYLFHYQNLDRRLSTLLEALFVELSAQAGVDYLHTQGIGDLNNRLTREMQFLSGQFGLGIVVDRVTVDSVDPPAQVLADFQDVANARSEAAQVIQQARTYAEQRVTTATATAQERVATAISSRRTLETTALAQAEHFHQLHRQLIESSSAQGIEYPAQKSRWQQQQTRELLQAMMASGVRTWLFDAERPVNLQLQRNVESNNRLETQ